jgi:hypothetical protein
MLSKIAYDFSAELWQHPSEGGWHFISLPLSLSKEIRENLAWQEEGWGRMKVIAKLGSLQWETAIWFDRKAGTYLLPIKAEVRKKTKIQVGQTLNIQLFI